MTKVKICGLTEPETVHATIEAGADWIGFNFIPESPRFAGPKTAPTLVQWVGGQSGRCLPVALVSDASDDVIDKLVEAGFPILQLHGSETPERAAEIKARAGVDIWKAIGISEKADLALCEAYEAVARLLIEAKPPKGADYRGGHGKSFDWNILKGWTAPKPWILAGGLTPENVTDAIAATGAPAVDVSSGVEKAPGVKDAALIKAFIQAAKAR